MSLHSRKKAGFPIKLSLDQVIDLIPFYTVQCALFGCITSFYTHPLNASCLPGTLCWAQWIQRLARLNLSLKGSQSKESDAAIWVHQSAITWSNFPTENHKSLAIFNNQQPYFTRRETVSWPHSSSGGCHFLWLVVSSSVSKARGVASSDYSFWLWPLLLWSHIFL